MIAAKNQLAGVMKTNQETERYGFVLSDQYTSDFIKEQTGMFLKAQQNYDPALAQYLFGALRDILVRLENMK